MGNSPSTEAPRKPHKLSKPRVGNHASAAGLLSANNSVSNFAARFSNSYLVGSPPIPPPEPSPIKPSPVGIAVAVSGEVVQDASLPSRKASRRGSRRMSNLFRSKSYKSENATRQNSLIPPVSRTSSTRPSRTNSQAQDAAVRPLARADSMQSSANRGSVHYDTYSYEAQRLLDLNNEMPKDPPVPPLPLSVNHLELHDVTENTWKSVHMHRAPNSPIARTNSELSLYTPMRRRSLIQTPGVATRAQPSSRQISAKSSFYKSQPPTPTETRHNSMESNVARRMTMPSVKHDFHHWEPEVTPSDGEYKQLGAMKFGSLRIMNGTPVSSIGPEDEAEAKEACTPVKASSLPSANPGRTDDGDENTIKIAHPKPILKVVSPAATTFTDGETANSHSNPERDTPRVRGAWGDDPGGVMMLSPSSVEPVSPTSSLQIRSKHTADEDDLFEDENTSEYSTVEVLDVREAPNAKPSPEAVQRDLERKGTGTMSRSDSGYVGSSSSEAPQQPLAKADSGYSSAVSLRSLRSKTGSVRGSRISSEKNASSRRDMNPSTDITSPTHEKPDEEDDSSLDGKVPTPPPKDDVVTPSRATFSPQSRGGITRVPSLRSSLPREAQPHDTAPALGRSRSRALSADSINANVSGRERPGAPRGRLQRFLSSSRGRGPPKVQNAHRMIKEVPRASPDVEYFQEHDDRFPMARRWILRAEPSRGTLKTILSVGSGDLLQNEQPPNSEKEPASPKQKDLEPKISRRQSFRAASQSLKQAASSFLSSAKQDGRSSLSRKYSGTMDGDVDGESAGPGPESTPEFESAMSNVEDVRRSRGDGAFDRSFAATGVEHGVAIKAMRVRPQPIDLGSRAPSRTLRTRASAPNCQGTAMLLMSPTTPEAGKKSRSPPPVSMRTRGSRKSKRNHATPPQRARSTPPGGVPVARRPPIPHMSSREGIQSYPPALDLHQSLSTPLSPAMTSPVSLHQMGFAGPQIPPSHSRSSFRQSIHDGPRYVVSAGQPTYSKPQHASGLRHRSGSEGYGLSGQLPSHPHAHDPWLANQYRQHGRAPPIPRPNHSRRRSAESYGQNPPYRILHSYNSPAYRGVPIWG